MSHAVSLSIIPLALAYVTGDCCVIYHWYACVATSAEALADAWGKEIENQTEHHDRPWQELATAPLRPPP